MSGSGGFCLSLRGNGGMRWASAQGGSHEGINLFRVSPDMSDDVPDERDDRVLGIVRNAHEELIVAAFEFYAVQLADVVVVHVSSEFFIISTRSSPIKHVRRTIALFYFQLSLSLSERCSFCHTASFSTPLTFSAPSRFLSSVAYARVSGVVKQKKREITRSVGCSRFVLICSYQEIGRRKSDAFSGSSPLAHSAALKL